MKEQMHAIWQQSDVRHAILQSFEEIFPFFQQNAGARWATGAEHALDGMQKGWKMHVFDFFGMYLICFAKSRAYFFWHVLDLFCHITCLLFLACTLFLLHIMCFIFCISCCFITCLLFLACVPVEAAKVMSPSLSNRRAAPLCRGRQKKKFACCVVDLWLHLEGG